MKKPEEALHDILELVHPLGTEMLDVAEASGRVLGEDVIATRDLPPWDNSAMDGYALNAAGSHKLVQHPVPVAFTVAAGTSGGPLPPGHVARIMTGAPLPEGANAVIMREEVDETNAAAVVMKRAVQPGENVRHRGEDMRAGAPVLQRGHLLSPADIGLLCAVGRARVRVRRRPVVAILSTGDELAEVGEAPDATRIVNSNAWMLAAQVRDAGGIPRVLPVAADTRESLQERLEEASGADVLLSSGGVSVGDYDFVKEALEAAGASLGFWRVAIKPGKPLAVGTMKDMLVFGLPGNPVSSFVTFELFVRPALLALQGWRLKNRRAVQATVFGSYAKKPGMTHYIRCELVRADDGSVEAHPRTQQSSGALTSISGAHGLIVVEDRSSGFKEGDTVRVMVLRDDWDGDR